MDWKISSNQRQKHSRLVDESLFFTGNGYLGVRGNFEEGYSENTKTIRGTYLNAFYETVSIPYGEKLYAFPETQQKLLNVIDTQTIEIFLGDEQNEERFSMEDGEVLSFDRHLHLDRGFAERNLKWRSPKGKELHIRFKRFASFCEKEVFIQQIELSSTNYVGRVRIVSSVNGNVRNYVDTSDPRVASNHAKLLTVTQIQQLDSVSYVECATKNSKLKTACAVSYQLDSPFQSIHHCLEDSIKSEIISELTNTLVFEKKTIFLDTMRHGEDLLESALILQKKLETVHFASLLAQQEYFLTEFWKTADIQIDGDPKLQVGIRFNLFHLLQSVGRDSFSNIAAKGLSGEGYEGHYFWDTEIYIFPVFLITKPNIARNLLLYRYATLDAARNRAREMGHHKGALFPWRTISGTECSSFFPSGTAQYHISADIAYSFIQYYLVTNDETFMKEFGAEILFETARLWAEIGHFDGGTFKIDAVTGPDEYTCMINNNYYTNVMAKYNLYWAVKCYRLLKTDILALCEKINLQEEEILIWENAANQMYLPYDETLGVNPQDDTFLQKAIWDLKSTPKEKFPLLLHYHPLTLYRYQVCKQADTVLAHFLLEDMQSIETIRNSYNYYEKITTHDSSLSTCVFSMMASKLGYNQKAYDYFIETARLDLENTHGNTKDGLHMANMGGTWLAIVFGFAGLRIKEDGISFYPALPKKWKGYRFSIQFQGRSIQIEKASDQTILTLHNGKSLSIKVYNQSYLLKPNEPIILSWDEEKKCRKSKQ
ncbi:MAG TPA: glycosyl hydrolase family 65 protein [Bacillales bacterium]|nr:glycosyl hydrolase family 65 protein [Bacillales bacterium]